jgi:2-pyrone-4,6-dicarboxylate lactonase
MAHTPPPHPSPKRPDLELPPLSCDAHCHVFGPGAVFPYAENRTFTPPDVSKEDLRRRHEFLGIERAVIVQSSCHGTDHAALLDALASSDRYRGVALVTAETPEAEIARLDAAGVRGGRLNFMPHLGATPSPEAIDTVIRLIRPYGWHLGLHMAGRGIVELAQTIRAAGLPVIVDHMARVELSDTEAVETLLRLLDTGQVWVKLSGADRLSAAGPPYSDVVPLASRLAAHAPERVLWGTDFPHPNVAGDSPDDGVLVDFLGLVAPGGSLRRRILVDNPAAVFGF